MPKRYNSSYAGVASVLGPYAYRQMYRSYKRAASNRGLGSKRSRPYLRGRKPRNKSSYVRRKTRKPSVKTNRKKIAKLKSRLDTSQTQYKLRTRSYNTFTSGVNQSSHNEIEVYTNFAIQDALQSVPYVDPENPAVVKEIDLNEGIYSRKVLIKSVYSHIQVTNPSNATANLRMYCLRPKKDTNTSPIIAFQQGINAIMQAPQYLSTQVFLSDSELFKDLYHVIKHKDVSLKPGRTTTYAHGVKDFIFDTSIEDNEAENFKIDLKPLIWVFRLEGLDVNDDNAGGRGTQQTKILVREDKHIHIEYDGGTYGIKRIKLVDEADAMTAPMFVNNPCVCPVTFKANAADRRLLEAEANTLAVNSLNTNLSAGLMTLADAIMESEDHLSDIADNVEDIADDVDSIASDIESIASDI